MHCTWIEPASRSCSSIHRLPVKYTTSSSSSDTTAEPENTPPLSAATLGASAMGSRRHVTRSALLTCPQCTEPHSALKGWCWKNTW
jgi:hypothetical protein